MIQEASFEVLEGVETLLVAYSGGLDSHVLLHQLASHDRLKDNYTIKAVHINHGLSSFSLDWEKHCQQICLKLNVPLEVIRVDAKPVGGESPEAAARRSRYDALREKVRDTDCLLTAHHQEDQAETLLLQLFRGAGPKGLSSMPALTSFEGGYLYRPLLDYSQTDLIEYAKQHVLQWVDDDSNTDSRYDRNFLRHEILPQLKARWPSLARSISRSAYCCAEHDALLDTFLQDDFEKVFDEDTKTLDAKQLADFPALRQRHLIRYWLGHLKLPLPSKAKLDRVEQDVLKSRYDAVPLVSWPGAEVRRFRYQIYAIPPQRHHDPRLQLRWDLNEELVLPNGLGILNATMLQNAGLQVVPEQSVTVRFRQGGERFRPAGRQGSHPLKKLLQEWHVPPWERDRIPLIYLDDRLVCVVGYGVEYSSASPKESEI